MVGGRYYAIGVGKEKSEVMDRSPSNVPIPDPSLATNERLAAARGELEGRIDRNMEQCKEWVEALQVLHEEKIKGAEDKTANLDRVVQTRLAGSETALNAAMAAADKVTQKQADNFEAVLTEAKIGLATQIKSLNEKIDGLKERISETGGHSSGVSHSASMIISALAALAAIASVAIILTKSAPTPLSSPVQPSIFHKQVKY